MIYLVAKIALLISFRNLHFDRFFLFPEAWHEPCFNIIVFLSQLWKTGYPTRQVDKADMAKDYKWILCQYSAFNSDGSLLLVCGVCYEDDENFDRTGYGAIFTVKGILYKLSEKKKQHIFTRFAWFVLGHYSTKCLWSSVWNAEYSFDFGVKIFTAEICKQTTSLPQGFMLKVSFV